MVLVLPFKSSLLTYIGNICEYILVPYPLVKIHRLSGCSLFSVPADVLLLDSFMFGSQVKHVPRAVCSADADPPGVTLQTIHDFSVT